MQVIKEPNHGKICALRNIGITKLRNFGKIGAFRDHGIPGSRDYGEIWCDGKGGIIFEFPDIFRDRASKHSLLSWSFLR